jgi:hypothetical protein
MKRAFITLIAIYVLTSVYGASQNKLSIPIVEGGLGKEVTIPVSLTNDSSIVAAQFKLHFPTGCSVNTSSATLTSRKDDHTLSVKNLGNNDYLFIVFSGTNKAIKSNSGALLQLNVTIPLSWKMDSTYTLSFNQLILSAANGRNLATTSDAGAIKVTNDPRPDITVQNITCGTTTWKPGQKITISWQVKNIGNKSTGGEWNEQLIAVDGNGNEAMLGNAGAQDVLQAGATVSRQSEVTIPDYPGIDGTVRIKVKLLPADNLGELAAAAGNNTATSTATFQLSKQLNLKITESALLETVKTPIGCFVYRSGSRTTDQTVTLRCNQTNRISFPNTVTIKAGESGAYFTIQSTDNSTLDADSTCILFAKINDYNEVADTLIIYDNELPALKISVSKSTLSESESATLLVERPVSSAKSLTVKLSCNQSKRLNLPTELVIPANQKTVSFSLMSVDDYLPALTTEATIIASATGFESDTASLSLTDNDMPQLAITFSPSTVSESAGVQASVVTVKRTGVTNNAITVKITDDAAGALFYSNSTLSFAAGETEKQITMGVVDNVQMEGTRTFSVSASVYMASCGCSASSQGIGMVSSNLSVLDDDGPTLKITSTETMLPEGRIQATMLTISRNTSTTQALAFTLTSTKDDMLTYQQSASIPAGSASVTIPITVKSNSTTEGNQTVTFTASASGFTNGVCWAMITDQTLPDATVMVLSATPSKATVKATTQLELLVKNTGVSSLAANTPVSIYLCNNTDLSTSTTKQLLQTTYTTTEIAAAGNESSYISVSLPNLTGNYYIIAAVNENKAVTELSTLNNTSNALSFEIEPAYNIELHTDKTKYKTGEQIVFSGKAVSNGSGNISQVDVEIYMITNGFRHTVTAKTDANGNFTLNYTPYQGQMGHFSAGACYPGQGLTEEKVALDVYGLSRTSAENIIWDVVANELNTGEIEILNEGNLSITGLKCNVLSCPADVQLTFESIASITAGGTTKLKYSLIGSNVSTLNQYEKISFQVTSTEGATLDILAYYYCRSQSAVLKGSVPAIETTMAKGTNRTFEYIITNIGKGETGKISIATPSNNWLKLITPSEIPTLKTGETATVIFQFSPTDDMQANVPVTGNIGINCGNGNGIALPFRIETVSEKTGALKIDVCDEYTYNTQAAPHLSGAIVKVKHPFTGAIISEGVTGSDGIFSIPNLPEGYYTVVVTAAKHGYYQNEIYVEAGKTKAIEVFIQFQAITYSWDVIPSTFDDKYEVNLITKFETYVPKPVVLIDMPLKFPALSVNEEFAFIVTLTNKGLITAKNVELNFPKHPLYEFSTTYHTADIPANSSINVFVLMHHKKVIQKSSSSTYETIIDTWDRAEEDVTNVFCKVYKFLADYFYLCGNQELKDAAVTAMNIPIIDEICNDDNEFTFTLPDVPNNPKPNNPTGGNHELQGPWENGSYNPDCLLYTLCPGLKREPLNTKGLTKAKYSADAQKTVCASVSLKFSQSVSITREAFEGTLKINNGIETGEMKNIKLELEIKDKTGTVRNDLFQINTLSLDQITGIDGNGIIEALKTGTAIIQFIPEKGAAPAISKAYSFGGTLSYLDPYSGEIVTTKLLPVTLTVKPCPDLYLSYFIQRDVFGDDPLTAAVEPIEPAELSLLINNKGAGDATKVILDSEQPQIIENEKGLNIDFKMIGSSLKGAPTSIGLSRVDFGDISGGKTSYAQWWFTSSLLGHFSEYKAELTHLTSFDNPDLSLISDVSIHELIRSIEAKTVTNETVTAFLTNDMPDDKDQPDMLYLADGTTDRVYTATTASITKTADNVYSLTVSPAMAGYNYGNITDPTNGRAKLVSIKRVSDNASLSLRNFWQTDRTLIDKKEPMYEFKLHFVDKFTASAGTYILTFEPKPLKILEVKEYENAPAANVSSSVQRIDVTFNKDIDASTFGVDDVILKCKGESMDLSGKLTITKLTANKFKLDISKLTTATGYYELTVHTNNIADLENYQGENGKQIGWTQTPIDVQLTLQVNPTSSGTLNAALGANTKIFNSTVNLTATPVIGYKFVNWTIDDTQISIQNTLSVIADAAKKIVANFELINCVVQVKSDAKCVVSGATSSVYKYNDVISLNVTPAPDYKFIGWKIDNSTGNNQKTIQITVNKDVVIEPQYHPVVDITYKTTPTTQWNSNWQYSTDGTTWVDNDGEPEPNVKSVVITKEIELPVGKTVQQKTVTLSATAKLDVKGALSSAEKIIVESNDLSTGQILNAGSLTNNGQLILRKNFKSTNGWYYMSFPFDVLFSNIKITSTQAIATTESFKIANSPYKNIYFAQYNGQLRDQTGVAKSSDSPNWEPVTSGTLKGGKGYAVRVMSDQTFDFISSTSENAPFDKMNKTQQVGVFNTNALSEHHGWNFVGIPYSSSFDLDNLSQGQFFYIYDMNSKSFRTIEKGGAYKISPFSAFFMQSGSEQLQFYNTGKALKIPFSRPVEDEELAMSIVSDKGEDNVKIRLNDFATTKFDKAYDAVKMESDASVIPQLWCDFNQCNYSVLSIPKQEYSIPIMVKVNNSGMYKIRFDKNNINDSRDMYLFDNQENKLIDMTPNSEYEFYQNGTSVQKRFTITFVKNITTTLKNSDLETLKIKQINNALLIEGLNQPSNVQIFNTRGQVLANYSNVYNNQLLNFNSITGIYFIKIQNQKSTNTFKFITK